MNATSSVSVNLAYCVFYAYRGTHMAKSAPVEADITQVKIKLFLLFIPQLNYTALGQTQYKLFTLQDKVQNDKLAISF